MTIGTEQSFSFVGESLPARMPARILEIGPGEGELARTLMDQGHSVMVVEPSAENAAACRAKDIDVLEARWPSAVPGGPFDAVMFIRSLHHIDPLEGAVAAAHDNLRPGGLLLLDDFAFKETKQAAMDWFHDRLRGLVDADVIFSKDTFPDKVLKTRNAYDTWTASHHHIHDFGLMREAINQRFEIITEAKTPYLYRYVEAAAPSGEPRGLGQAVLEEEAAAISAGRIEPMGRRLVARLTQP